MSGQNDYESKLEKVVEIINDLHKMRKEIADYQFHRGDIIIDKSEGETDMQAEQYLKCTDCGHPLTLEMAHDGCDWESEAGKGSGYGEVVYLSCGNCGRIYEIVRYRNHGDVSVPIKEHRTFIY